jgi:hypothetical protein
VLQGFPAVLEDGVYDALVVDASDANDEDDVATTLDLAITSGPRKGDVVSVRARRLPRDALELLATPVTLHVEEGQPRVVFDTA